MLPLQRSTFCSLAIVFALLAAIASLRAAPPSDADPAMADWFGGLQQPNSGLPCCSIADCRVAEVRADSGGYDVKIDDVWMAVPPNTILDHVENPTGGAVVCYHRFYDDNRRLLPIQILCFVRPPDS